MVVFRNVNLRSTVISRQDIGYHVHLIHNGVGTMFFGDRGREGQRGWAFATL